MRVIKITMIILAILIVLIIGVVGAFLVYITVPNDRTIAKNIKVSNDWTEIDAEPPFTAQHQVQTLGIRTPGINFHSTESDEVKLKDGTVLHPEIELIDDQGKVQPLRLRGFVQKYFVDAEYYPAQDTDGFHFGRKFSKVRIRSDVPFECTAIYWRDTDLK